MVTYKVTTEINSSWWKHIFRFFNLFPPREEFEIVLNSDWYKEGDILRGNGANLLCLGVNFAKTNKTEINCTGNNGNGCYLDSCGHSCGCEGISPNKK